MASASQEIVPLQKYSVMQIDPVELQEALADNLGGEQIREFDLPTVKIPSGGQTSWSVPSVSGEKIVKTIEGVIIAHKWTRGYWADSLDDTGGGQPPDCSAPDARTGTGFPFRKPGEVIAPDAEPVTMACEECPNSQFGSARSGRGQACQHRKLIMLLPPTGLLPLIVNLAPTSGQPARDFFLGLSGEEPPVSYRRAHVKIGLEKVQGQGVPDYAKATFELVDTIDDEVLERINAIGDVFRTAFATARVVNAEGDVKAV